MAILRLYDTMIRGLAVTGAASLGFITLLIAYGVASRNLALPALRWSSAVVEYMLLFSTMLAGPWLVRNGGHVAVTAIVDLLPAGLRTIAARAVLIVSAATLFLLSVVAGQLTLEQFASGSTDIRSVPLPGWILYAMLTLGFLLMATEFLRLLIRGETYSGEGGH
ncbi:TRAP transporter small permease [Pelagibius sp.]|uniref:TRAP transporter small permease n=1 Tax=Pelagibius sp. TaxID=1931238 RepID=UPI003BAEC08B